MDLITQWLLFGLKKIPAAQM
uniref:Uncharacterized protein n=1 Tax=Anguilla anguilla TaxID=7936 RepID=A0A0E9V9Y8_ANGAN